MRRTLVRTIAVIAVLAAMAATSVIIRTNTGERGDGESAREIQGENEAQEIQERLARAAGGKPSPSPTGTPSPAPSPVPAPGWAGERNVGTEDTWEPSIAADPTAPYVYVMYNRFNGTKACKNCPTIPMMLRVSSDNGVTWGPETYPCPCPGAGTFQYDPVMKVANNGVVYATWMNKYDMVFSKSLNHGATWTTPIEVSGTAWGDHPWIGVSPNGTDVYISYETSADVWVAASHDSGATWAPAVQLNNDTGKYRYPNGLEVLPNGTAVMSASSYPGGAKSTTGAVDIETWRSTDGGATWTRAILQTVYTGVNFETSSTTALASDSAGTLVALYSGATATGGKGHIWSRRSTDGGATWAAAVELDNGTNNASFPAITGGAAGDFRVHYGDDRGGAWNTWYRSSTNGGTSWSAEADISEVAGGPAYKTAAGFNSEYGDYSAIDITNTGKSVAAWGEGASFSGGPGGIWMNRQT